MSDPQVAIMMMGLFVIFVLLGFPICFTLVAMGVGFGYYAYAQPDQWDHIFQNRVFDLLVNQTYSVMINDVLVAVPLFLFIGYVLERANIVDRLFFSLSIAARAIPGSMAVAALATCAIFATAVGIIGAVVPGNAFHTRADAEAYRPLLAAANKHKAMLFIHWGPRPGDAWPRTPAGTDNISRRLGTIDMQQSLSRTC